MFLDKITVKPELNSPDLHINPSRFPCMSNTSCTELHQDKKLIFQPITASTIQLISYFNCWLKYFKTSSYYVWALITIKKDLSASKIVTKFSSLNLWTKLPYQYICLLQPKTFRIGLQFWNRTTFHYKYKKKQTFKGSI